MNPCRLSHLLFSGLLASAVLFQPLQAVAQEISENASNHSIIFRYKQSSVGPVASPGTETPGDDQPAIKTVTPEPLEPDIWGNPSSPLTLTSTISDSDVGADRMVYQCFQASGGEGEYLWLVMADVMGDTSWVEAHDIVERADLNTPMMPFASYSDKHVSAPLDTSMGGFKIDYAGEACIRVKVREDAAPGGEAIVVELGLEDNHPDDVVAGYLVEDAFYGAESYATLDVLFTPECEGSCGPSDPGGPGGEPGGGDLFVMGMPYVELEVGPNLSMWWVEEDDYDPRNYTWTIDHPAFYFQPEEMAGWQIVATTGGFYGGVVITATHVDTGESGWIRADLQVAEGEALAMTGPDSVTIETGQDYIPWVAEGGFGHYTWTLSGVPSSVSIVESGVDWMLRATQVGVYEDAVVRVEDEAGNSIEKAVVLTVEEARPSFFAFGQNDGNFGNGNTFGATVPREVSTYHDFKYVSAGAYSCGIEANASDLYCWGDTSSGYLGLGDGVKQLAPETPVEPRGAWTMVDTGTGSSNCAIRNGDLYCWGYGTTGVLGMGSSVTDVNEPALVSSGGWSDVAVSLRTACGIKGGDLYCWGELPNGVRYYTPTRIGDPGGWTDIDVGIVFGCGIRSGEMWCWGSNSEGQAGSGEFSYQVEEPTRIAGDPGGWSDVAVGSRFACGLRFGEIRCWGDNQYGQLGDGTEINKHTAQNTVGSSNWASVAAGEAHACAIKNDGSTHCWGFGGSGRLGSNVSKSSTPLLVSDELAFTQIAAGSKYSIGLATRSVWNFEEDNGAAEYDHGLDECGGGGVGWPVCEDFSPLASDPIWDGYTPATIRGISYDKRTWTGDGYQPSSSVRTTGRSSQSMTDTGQGFGYVCYHLSNPAHSSFFTYTKFGVGPTVYDIMDQRWIKYADVVPRRDLFKGPIKPLVFESDDWDLPETIYYPDGPGGLEERTSEQDICIRIAIEQPSDEWKAEHADAHPMLYFETHAGPRDGLWSGDMWTGLISYEDTIVMNEPENPGLGSPD